jgi:hypothetical protein
MGGQDGKRTETIEGGEARNLLWFLTSDPKKLVWSSSWTRTLRAKGRMGFSMSERLGFVVVLLATMVRQTSSVPFVNQLGADGLSVGVASTDATGTIAFISVPAAVHRRYIPCHLQGQ